MLTYQLYICNKTNGLPAGLIFLMAYGQTLGVMLFSAANLAAEFSTSDLM